MIITLRYTHSLVIPGRVNAAFMFMPPNHKLQKAGKKIQAHGANTPPRVAVLVNNEQVEPAVVVGRLEKRHLVLFKHAGETLVRNVSHAVDSKFRGSLLEENRLDLDVLNATLNRRGDTYFSILAK